MMNCTRQDHRIDVQNGDLGSGEVASRTAPRGDAVIGGGSRVANPSPTRCSWFRISTRLIAAQAAGAAQLN